MVRTAFFIPVLVGFIGCSPSTSPPAAPVTALPPRPELHEAIAGTRESKDGPLRPAKVVTEPTYLGCDVRYRAIPVGAVMHSGWQVFATREAYESGRPTDVSPLSQEPIKGNGTVTSFLKAVDGGFDPGIYRCAFVLTLEDKELDHSTAEIAVSASKSTAPVAAR